ncbi:MAG TPA: hypothetical protein VFN49_05970 [Candidatus Aquilonibacter sp.]|nr:hypothetical protein [Candidatus Aquilonibacter sp.]
MIVTRQRKKPFPWKRLILPVIAIALVVFAFVWPPSRNVIAKGPAAPVWNVAGNAWSNVAEPFHFAAQNEALTQKNAQIEKLQRQVSDLQSQLKAKDNKINGLNAQVSQMQLQAANPSPAASSAPAAQQNGTTGAGGSNPGGIASQSNAGSDLAQGATPDMRRTAAYWGNMEPENAAKVIQKLPIPYVAHILALMSPDTVGSILDALPTSYAAKLTQDHPELKK